MTDLSTYFSEAEKQIIIQCARAITEGPFIHENGFHPRTGLEKSEAKFILENSDLFNLDGLTDYDRLSHLLLINNGMGEVTGLDSSTEAWKIWVIYPKESIREVLNKWRTFRDSHNLFKR